MMMARMLNVRAITGIIRCRNENISMKEVKDIYAPLTRLLKVYYDNYRRLNRTRKAFLEMEILGP